MKTYSFDDVEVGNTLQDAAGTKVLVTQKFEEYLFAEDEEGYELMMDRQEVEEYTTRLIKA